MKEALAVIHRPGPNQVPRKVVYTGLGKSESWYSLILDPETLDCPSLLDLRRISAITGNAEPLRVMARWFCDGFELLEPEPHRLLSDAIGSDALFTGRLARALEDNQLTAAEAKALVSPAEARLRQAQVTVDALKKRARRA